MYLNGIPILVPKTKGEKVAKDSISKFCKDMLNLHNKLLKLEENSNKWNEIKSEIEKVDKKIDEEVYKLYDLTSEEIATVEAN